jgi:lipoate-protein ligase A
MTDQDMSGGTAAARLVDVGGTSPLRAQSLYHGIADAMGPYDAPVIVMADPEAPFVSAGLHQDVGREIDVSACLQTNTPIIRRDIGGPMMELSAGDMMVHVVLPRNRPEAAGAAAGLYFRFAEPVIRTWRSFGLPVEHAAWGGIQLDRRRISQLNAGVIGRAAVVGGSIVRRFDPDIIATRARLPSDQLREQMRDAIRGHLARAADRPPDRAAIKEVLLGHLNDVLGWRLEGSSLRDDELAAVAWRDTQMDQSTHLFAGGRRMAGANLRAVGGLAFVDIVQHGAAGRVQLRLLERAGVIEELQITGELTALPGDGLEKLAPRLIGLRRDAPDLATRIHMQIGLLGVELPGVTAGDLATALRPVARRGG